MTQPPAPEPYEFTPVALTRVRHDGWTPERQRGFIAVLAVTGVVTAAARAVGMSGQSAYRLRGRAGAESFAAAWDLAQDEGFTRALSIALDRGFNGYTVSRFYAGREIAQVHRFDNRMALAALNARSRSPRHPRVEDE